MNLQEARELIAKKKKGEINVGMTEEKYIPTMSGEDLERLTKEGYAMTSEGDKISLRQVKHHFNRQISQLPQPEQNFLDSLYRSYRSYLGHKKGEKDEYGFTTRDKLSQHRQDIIELFGRMFSVDDVRLCCREKFGFTISPTALSTFADKFKEQIAEKQEHHKRNHWELRLSHKKSRIEELSELFYKLKGEFERFLRPTQAAVCKDILEAIRKETDGDLLTVKGILDVNLEATINLHLNKEILKTVDLKNLILTRVAAKTGVRSGILNYSLYRSYYHDLNNVQDATIIEDFNMPSTQEYNFENIKQKNAVIEEEFRKIENSMDVEKNDLIDIGHFKEQLLKKTMEQVDIIKRKQNAISAINYAREAINKDKAVRK